MMGDEASNGKEDDSQRERRRQKEREAARRSRKRKQDLLEALREEVTRLKTENENLWQHMYGKDQLLNMPMGPQRKAAKLIGRLVTDLSGAFQPIEDTAVLVWALRLCGCSHQNDPSSLPEDIARAMTKEDTVEFLREVRDDPEAGLSEDLRLQLFEACSKEEGRMSYMLDLLKRMHGAAWDLQSMFRAYETAYESLMSVIDMSSTCLEKDSTSFFTWLSRRQPRLRRMALGEDLDDHWSTNSFSHQESIPPALPKRILPRPTTAPALPSLRTPDRSPTPALLRPPLQCSPSPTPEFAYRVLSEQNQNQSRSSSAPYKKIIPAANPPPPPLPLPNRVSSLRPILPDPSTRGPPRYSLMPTSSTFSPLFSSPPPPPSMVPSPSFSMHPHSYHHSQHNQNPANGLSAISLLADAAVSQQSQQQEEQQQQQQYIADNNTNSEREVPIKKRRSLGGPWQNDAATLLPPPPPHPHPLAMDTEESEPPWPTHKQMHHHDKEPPEVVDESCSPPPSIPPLTSSPSSSTSSSHGLLSSSSSLNSGSCNGNGILLPPAHTLLHTTTAAPPSTSSSASQLSSSNPALGSAALPPYLLGNSFSSASAAKNGGNVPIVPNGDGGGSSTSSRKSESKKKRHNASTSNGGGTGTGKRKYDEERQSFIDSAVSNHALSQPPMMPSSMNKSGLLLPTAASGVDLRRSFSLKHICHEASLELPPVSFAPGPREVFP
mmetsp:Transcript_33310/g.54045  ORF Transcript_33310/g.54045 Transcript_33310/m.54045 type:complete len:719 (-) Transcript_33310:632-2788(-)